MWRIGPTFLLLLVMPVEGLIFIDGPSPAPNTETAPTGPLAGSGWQHQVYYLNYHATVISPKHVITARHLGAAEEVLTRPVIFGVSQEETFAIKGERTLVGDTDFSIFEVWETFPAYVGLYQGNDEVGRELVIHGSGVGRGEEIIGKGWKWGEGETRKSRWGRNVIKGTTTSGGNGLLYFSFDDLIGQSEVMATGGDSGGGWFIQEGGEWKLAGVSFSVDSWHSEDPVPSNNNRFRGAFYQADGLSYGSDSGGWELIPASGQSNVPGEVEFYRQSHTYGSRISSRLVDIEAVIAPAIAWEAMDVEERFECWLAEHGVTVENGVTDDADGDGISNLEEYLTESHPGEISEAESGLILEVLPDGNHRMTFRESLDLTGRGLMVVVEESADLAMWEPVVDLVEESRVRDNVEGVRTRVMSRFTALGQERFYRLRIMIL